MSRSLAFALLVVVGCSRPAEPSAFACEVDEDCAGGAVCAGRRCFVPRLVDGAVAAPTVNLGAGSGSTSRRDAGPLVGSSGGECDLRYEVFDTPSPIDIV